MRRRLLVLCLLSACVDPLTAEQGFCERRPELCAPDGSTDAGHDAGVDAGRACPTNEEFDGTTWSTCSTLFEPITSNPFPRVENGALVFDQTGPMLGWSNGNGGSLLSQEFTGTFVAEVRARVVLPSDGGRLGIYTAAALLAVDPARPAVNSRLVSVGVLGDLPDGGLEYGVLSEGTQNTVSEYRFDPNGSTEALLRLCRVDAGWVAFTKQLDGGPWVGFQRIDAGVLSGTVRVGPAAYNVGGPTARIEHDYFRFSPDAATEFDCAARVLP